MPMTEEVDLDDAKEYHQDLCMKFKNGATIDDDEICMTIKNLIDDLEATRIDLKRSLNKDIHEAAMQIMLLMMDKLMQVVGQAEDGMTGELAFPSLDQYLPYCYKMAEIFVAAGADYGKR